MGIIRKLSVIIVVLLAGVGAAFYAGILPPGQNIEKPSASVKDIGDWGEVTDDKIEVIHTLNIQNPNPANVQIGDAITLTVQLQFNGVRLGSVQKTGLDIQQGNNTVKITSELQQDRIAEFWSKFINQDETIHARISVGIEMNIGPGFSISTPPVRVSVLTDSQPLSKALEQMGNEFERTYSYEVSTDSLPSQYRPDKLGSSKSVTVEWTVQSVRFEWGKVTPQQTKLLIHLRVKNTGDTPVPGYPDGLAADILLNDIEVFHIREESISARNIDRDSVIRQGQTKSYTLIATADNQRVEEWFTTFAKRGENSTIRTEFQLLFTMGENTLTLPQDGGLIYKCSFQTGIFNDGQNTSHTCGNGTFVLGPAQVNASTLRNLSSQTTTPTPTATPSEETTSTPTPIRDTATTSTTENNPPVARADASPTKGEAPLEVSFDASKSSDPDGDIERYVWRFGDGTTPKEGETVSHTYQTAGEYTAELTVIDSQGNRDTTTITITVESRVG